MVHRDADSVAAGEIRAGLSKLLRALFDALDEFGRDEKRQPNITRFGFGFGLP